MIVPMKKIAALTLSNDAKRTVETLRWLGVVHVEHQVAPVGKDISAIRDDIRLVDRAIKILSEEQFLHVSGGEAGKKHSDWKFVANHISDLQKRLNHLEEYSRNLVGAIKEWETWGDFDPEAINSLRGKGVYIKLYQIPTAQLKFLPKELVIEKISMVRGAVNIAVISRENTELGFKELALPRMSLDKMRQRLSENSHAIRAVKEVIEKYVPLKDHLRRVRISLESDLEFQKALGGIGRSGEVVYLTGYIPHDEVGQLQEAARMERWGLSITDPSEDDNVPTLIRNPRWVSLISSVFKLIDVVPGYRELDISVIFLIFFSIFFGMLIGDAGIGLIFIILTTFFKIKSGKRSRGKSVFALMYILSSCAVIWGLATGTFFGQQWIEPFFKPLVPALRSDKNIQSLCFFLGALHLSIAHLWRAILKAPSPKALADLGWVSILWGAFFLARSLILGALFPAFAKYLFIVGPIFVIFFTNPQKNLLKSASSGLGHLALNVVNSFTDVVSYIRLFAVGLAGVAIADAFNAMANGIGYDNVAKASLAVLVVIVGQGLNVILGPIAVLVHGVRLNVLEFCGHIDVKWTGIAYKPLKEEKA